MSPHFSRVNFSLISTDSSSLFESWFCTSTSNKLYKGTYHLGVQCHNILLAKSTRVAIQCLTEYVPAPYSFTYAVYIYDFFITQRLTADRGLLIFPAPVMFEHTWLRKVTPSPHPLVLFRSTLLRFVKIPFYDPMSTLTIHHLQ